MTYRVDFRTPIYEDMVVTAKWVDAAKEVKVQNIYFDQDLMRIIWDSEISGDDVFSIPAQIVPFNATQQDLTWTCSDPDILKVDPNLGLAMPKKAGDVTVTATAANGKSASITVMVRDPSYGTYYELSPKKETITLYEGEYGRVEVDTEGKAFLIGALEYMCDDSEIVDLRGCGVFRALKEGMTTITAEDSSVDGSCMFTVIVKLKEKKGTVAIRNGLEYVITKPWTKKAKAGAVKVKGFDRLLRKTCCRHHHAGMCCNRIKCRIILIWAILGKSF